MTRNQRVPQRRKPLLAVLSLVGIVLLCGVLFGRHGAVRYFALQKDLAERSAAAFQRVGRNHAMNERLYGLRTDQRMIEEAARSTLGVVGDDEIVIVFQTPRGSHRR